MFRQLEIWLNIGVVVVVAACLPFKPCTTPSPVTPVGSSGGKKRRVTPSNSGARCAAKNTRVELKKTSEKPVENPSDDKVVSSSCEVDCSSAVSLCTSSKTLPPRSSLDYFVHTTQKLEVTTSSTDGDFIDLTAEDECASEAAALSSTGPTAEADSAEMMPAAFCDEDVIKASEPVAAECNTETVTQLTCVPDVKPAEMAKMNDESAKKDSCTNELEVGEVQCSRREDAEDRACNIADGSDCTPDAGGAGSTCAVMPSSPQNVQEVDTSALCLLDGQKTTSNDTATQSMTDCDKSLDKSSSDAADVDIDTAKSPTYDNADDSDMKLSEAAVVLVRVDEENVKASSSGEKSEVSTTSANVNDNKKVTPDVNSKPKVRMFICMTVSTGTST